MSQDFGVLGRCGSLFPRCSNYGGRGSVGRLRAECLADVENSPKRQC